MPRARRSAPLPKGQSTISFAGRVTKAVPRGAKASVAAPLLRKIDAPVKEGEKLTEADEDKLADDDELSQRSRELDDAVAKEVVGLEEEEEEEEEVAVVVPEKTESERRAAEMGDAQIGRYWKTIEAERTAPRVHQDDLSLDEKVLRYFDISSQYGPCVGMPRLRRWQRAERLGLDPPVEVLAVLLRERNGTGAGMGIANVDKILNSIVVA